jgi:hypothetical protein
MNCVRDDLLNLDSNRNCTQFINVFWCEINLIDVNFHLQKSLEIFDKNSADRIWSKKDEEIKVHITPSCQLELRGISTNFKFTLFDAQTSNSTTRITPKYAAAAGWAYYFLYFSNSFGEINW